MTGVMLYKVCLAAIDTTGSGVVDIVVVVFVYAKGLHVFCRTRRPSSSFGGADAIGSSRKEGRKTQRGQMVLPLIDRPTASLDQRSG